MMANGNSRPLSIPLFSIVVFFFTLRSHSFFFATTESSSSSSSEVTPRPWPHQFHALLFINYRGSLEFTDLWYDWDKGLNFLIIRHQLRSYAVHDVEWNNGTTFVFHSDGGYCRSRQLEVGILRPNWAEGGNYLGQREMDGFLCNVWEKADGFIWYYEDVITKLPVYWQFHTGRAVHVMTFEVGEVAEEKNWQAPSYCFQNAYDI